MDDLDHLIGEHLSAAIVVDGSADETIGKMLAAGWTMDDWPSVSCAGKRIRYLRAPVMNAATVNQAIQGATCPRCQSPLRAIDTRLPTEAFQLGPQTPEMSRPAVIVECTDDEDCRWAMEVRRRVADANYQAAAGGDVTPGG